MMSRKTISKDDWDVSLIEIEVLAFIIEENQNY
jgi:hypothetical protein